MHSMTGYGRHTAVADGREMTVEIKTVNHRFLDINLRMPRGLLFLEETVRKLLSARISRGHADVFCTYRNTRADAKTVRVDAQLLAAYQSAFDQIARETGVPDDRTLTGLSALPDVLVVDETADDEQAVAALCAQAVSGALDALIRMRATEGDALRADTAARLDTLCTLRAQIAAHAPAVAQVYKARLDARIAELLDAPPDPQRLAQEVAFLADRAAIDEELTRLKSHIAQMRAALESPDPVGRKLDFLVQELGREVNTIGAKSQSTDISALVLSAKAEIEKIREQVQNIE